MKYLSLREMQLEELEILKDSVSFFEKNNISYYLCGGTLLGAIRHKGFIPWDDDIDICIPRKDYDKFIELAKNNKINDDYEILEISLKNTKYPFCKIVNKKIKLISKSSEDKNLWIDVFPIDGLPDSQEEIAKHIKKIMLYKGIIYLHTTSFKSIYKEKKSLKNRIIKIILKPIATIFPIKFCSLKMIKLAKKYNYSDSKYVGAYIWGYGKQEKLSKDGIQKLEVEFENNKFSIFKCYDEYLKNLYGEYMQLPPEEKRISHYSKSYKEEE